MCGGGGVAAGDDPGHATVTPADLDFVDHVLEARNDSPGCVVRSKFDVCQQHTHERDSWISECVVRVE